MFQDPQVLQHLVQVVKRCLVLQDLLVIPENRACRDLRVRGVTEVKEEIWENVELPEKKVIVDQLVYLVMTVLAVKLVQQENQACPVAKESQDNLALLAYRVLQVHPEPRDRWV